MSRPVSQLLATPRLRRWLLLVGLAVGGIWFLFFDSHSLVRRGQYYAEARQLQAENAALQAEIDRLDEQLEAGISDDLVEKVAREQYGMRRPNETVYPVEASTDRD